MLLRLQWLSILPRPLPKRGLRRGMLFGIPLSLALWGGIFSVAGCVSTPSYVICNEQGDEPGCGDSVEVVVSNEG